MADARTLARQRDAEIVMERTDNDISASKGKHRQGYEDLMAAAEAGQISHIVIWQTSRLWRNRKERAEGIERLAKAKVSVLACKGPDLDMTTAYGRGMAGLVGEFDTMESEVKSERIQRKHLELAEAGKWGGGGSRPYGYDRVFEGGHIVAETKNEAEAAELVRAAELLLSGVSINAIVRDFQDRGVLSATGKRWSVQALRGCLYSARVAGLREHQGKTYPAVWPAILDLDTWHLVRAKLDLNERPPGSRVRIHWLSGFIYCTCGAKMRVRASMSHGVSYVDKYQCPPKTEGGCNSRGIAMEPLQKLMRDYVVTRMQDPRVLHEIALSHKGSTQAGKAALSSVTKLERKLEALQLELDEADADDVPEISASIKRTRAKLQDARTELQRATSVPGIVSEDLVKLAPTFDGLPLDRKQSLLGVFVERVVIGPARRGINTFQADRIEIVPRQW